MGVMKGIGAGLALAFVAVSCRGGQADVATPPAAPAEVEETSGAPVAVGTEGETGDIGATSELITFFSDRSGNLDVWVVPAAGGEPVQLSDHPSDDYEPDWSPDGRLIVFASKRGGGAADLYLMNPDGTNVRRLTDTPEWTDDYPAFSPDGRTVVFQRTFEDRTPVTAEIVLLDLLTGEETLFTDNDDWDSTPSFSPDGDWVLFESNRTGTFEIWKVRRDGSEPTRLTDSPGGTTNLEARFSPDGSRIIYTTRARNAGDLVLMSADGGQVLRLTRTDDADGHGEWSPDGGTIVFHRSGDLYLMDADGHNLRRLTSGPGRDLDPHWG
ncbi:MAG: hypothetical protein ACE5KX_07270 [Acidimicrobiia bacterium]